MLIMSQDKKKVANADNVLAIEIYAYDGDKFALVGSGYTVLGAYTTEAKAKEVLLELYDLWWRGYEHYEMPEE